MGRITNLGSTRLARRRVSRDPMAEFDALPPDLRHWLARAALPWSPRSCLKIWQRASEAGAGTGQILDRLTAAEHRLLLVEETHSPKISPPADRPANSDQH